MRNIRTVTALLLAAAMILPITACGKSDKNPDTTAEPAESSAPTGTETSPDQTEDPAKAGSLSINGVPLSEYTIVYAATTSGYKRNTSMYNALEHGQENDFNKVTAQELQSALAEKYGVTLSIATDSSAAGEHEILVGNTKRGADDVFASNKNDDYTVGMSDGSLCFVGGAYGTTYHSVEYFMNYLSENAGDVDLPADFKLEGKHHLTVIGCIGDSITEGIGSSNSMYSYPEAMNRILWKDCVVLNYGVSGMTMRNDTGGWAYMATGRYSEAQRNAPNVDVFTIMLGTNDSRGDIVGGYGKDQAKFEKGFSDLLAGLSKRGKNARYILMNCPAYYGNESYGADYIVQWQGELYEKYKESYDLSFFDMRTFSKKNMPSKYFGDLLHPNDAGYVIMAEGIANMLKEYLGLEG